MKYQGHKNWNHWNVCLWINNDYDLYRSAVFLCKRLKNRNAAAQALLTQVLPIVTPDGAPYTFSSVRAALVGIL